MANTITNKALLVIDIQEDATGNSGRSLFKNTQNFINTANNTIKKFQDNNDEIFYIKHELDNNIFNKLIMGNRFIKNTKGAEIDSRINIVNNNIYSKNKGNALINPLLEKALTEKNISDIYIIGLDAKFCVYSTAKGCIRRGFKTFIIENAILTGNMKCLPDLLKKYKKKGINIISDL